MCYTNPGAGACALNLPRFVFFLDCDALFTDLYVDDYANSESVAVWPLAFLTLFYVHYVADDSAATTKHLFVQIIGNVSWNYMLLLFDPIFGQIFLFFYFKIIPLLIFFNIPTERIC